MYYMVFPTSPLSKLGSHFLKRVKMKINFQNTSSNPALLVSKISLTNDLYQTNLGLQICLKTNFLLQISPDPFKHL